MKTLEIKKSNEGTVYEKHEVVLTNSEDSSTLVVSYAKTPRGAKMCLSRYGKEQGFTKQKDGTWIK